MAYSESKENPLFMNQVHFQPITTRLDLSLSIMDQLDDDLDEALDEDFFFKLRPLTDLYEDLHWIVQD
jgi:hypothetical protein